jgi:hypothetical protein
MTSGQAVVFAVVGLVATLMLFQYAGTRLDALSIDAELGPSRADVEMYRTAARASRAAGVIAFLGTAWVLFVWFGRANEQPRPGAG